MSSLCLKIKLLEIARKQFSEEFQKKIEVSTFEKELGLFRGSLFLMESLGRSYPDRQFGFIMGGDTLEKLGTWNDPVTGALTGERFLESVPCCIFARESQSLAMPLLSRAHPLTKCVADLDTVAQQLGHATYCESQQECKTMQNH
jgi:nicotinic acid mononucleotide adenylyltransferase